MKQSIHKWQIWFFVAFLLLLVGCSTGENATISLYVTTPIEVDAEVLSNVSVTLPEGMTRENVSDIQHDFVQDGKQVGGIVIVDIPEEMLDSPYNYFLQVSDLLGQQLTPDANADEIEFIGTGGNAYAYMEIYTGKGENIRYFHYLFRGQNNTYDVWFAYNFVDSETRNEIIATVSSGDITDELNQSPF